MFPLMFMLPLMASGKITFLPLRAPGGCWQSLVFFGLCQHNSSLCLHLHILAIILLCLCISIFSFYKDYLSLESILMQCAPMLTLLIISAKAPFPNKVTLWGSWWTWILGGHYSIHYHLLYILSSSQIITPLLFFLNLEPHQTMLFFNHQT